MAKLKSVRESGSSIEQEKKVKPKIKSSDSKLVIRCFPPSFTEEDIKDYLSPLPDHDYFVFCPTDASLGELAMSRAYINLKNPEQDLQPFFDAFNGQPCVDAKGSEFTVLVEWAPYQKIPRRCKTDPRSGTFETDPDYLAFLEIYNKEVSGGVLGEDGGELNPEQLLVEMENESAAIAASQLTTPLIDFIKEKKQRILEEKDLKRKKREEGGFGSKNWSAVDHGNFSNQQATTGQPSVVLKKKHQAPGQDHSRVSGPPAEGRDYAKEGKSHHQRKERKARKEERPVRREEKKGGEERWSGSKASLEDSYEKEAEEKEVEDWNDSGGKPLPPFKNDEKKNKENRSTFNRDQRDAFSKKRYESKYSSSTESRRHSSEGEKSSLSQSGFKGSGEEEGSVRERVESLRLGDDRPTQIGDHEIKGKSIEGSDAPKPAYQSADPDDSKLLVSTKTGCSSDSKQKIKNKDRPAQEIYRPGSRLKASRKDQDEQQSGHSDDHSSSTVGSGAQQHRSGEKAPSSYYPDKFSGKYSDSNWAMKGASSRGGVTKRRNTWHRSAGGYDEYVEEDCTSSNPRPKGSSARGQGQSSRHDARQNWDYEGDYGDGSEQPSNRGSIGSGKPRYSNFSRSGGSRGSKAHVYDYPHMPPAGGDYPSSEEQRRPSQSKYASKPPRYSGMRKHTPGTETPND